MEFYVYRPGNENWKHRRFNSQRDGILHNATGYVMKYITFQFPTGWNSTRWVFCDYYEEIEVSIPNGMEFYAPLKSASNNHR